MRRVGVGVGAARHRDHRREFGVAQPGEQAAQPRDGEGNDHAGAGIGRGRVAGDDEDARADDGADAERDQVDRPQRAFQIVNLGDGIFRNSGHASSPADGSPIRGTQTETEESSAGRRRRECWPLGRSTRWVRIPGFGTR